MELANIEKLLEKYLDASIRPLQEEAILGKLFQFSTGDIAPHLQEYEAYDV